MYAKMVLGRLPIIDTTGGFKCWQRSVLEKIGLETIRSNGYVFQIEMTYRAWSLGYRIVEIPIIFTDRKKGESKMNLGIAVEALYFVWWLRIKNLLGKFQVRLFGLLTTKRAD